MESKFIGVGRSKNRMESKLNFDEWESYLEFTRTLSPTVRALED